MRRLALTGAFLSLLVFGVLFPISAFADISQPVADTETTDFPQSSGGWRQQLGTGLSGTATELDFPITWREFNGYPIANGRLGITVTTCEDAAYTSCSGVSTNGLSITAAVGTTTAVFKDGLTDGPLNFTFDPTKYYLLDIYRISDGSPDTRFRVWGSASDTYPYGATTAGGLADLAFTIKGVSYSSSTPLSGPSSVLFLPGIEGSTLSSNGIQLWPPPVPAQFIDTLKLLALDSNGSSILPVSVNGVVNTFYGTPVYSGFSSFMDGLKSDGTISDWKPLAYDWRYSPIDIVQNGINTPEGTVYPVTIVEQLAASSTSGKVTIVAHSYGGLVGKAIIKALVDKGEGNLIDNFVMVGSPQLGTPQAAAGLLEGDDQAIPGGGPLPGLIVDQNTARSIALNFESAYDLLPSRAYFTHVSDPVIQFGSDSSFTQAWRDYWGQCQPGVFCLNTYDSFKEFLTGLGVPRDNNLVTLFRVPAVLNPVLVDKAQAYHDEFDTYAYPADVRVVQVAGWGTPTAKTLSYQNIHFLGLATPIPGYDTVPTIEGDQTVTYTSALSSSSGGKYFFDLKSYNSGTNNAIQHKDLLNAGPIQEMILSIIQHNSIIETNYVKVTKPQVASVADQLIVSTHSPVVLTIKDAQGNTTGVIPGQDPNSQFLLTSEEIPGSSFSSFGGSEYILLPKEGTYTVTFKGTGSGPATVKTGVYSNDSVISSASYTDIPVTTNTQGVLTVDSGAPADAHVQIDENGDGQTDVYVSPDNGPLSLSELLVNLTTAINSLTIKDKQRAQLLNKVQNLQNKIAKQTQKQSKVLAQLQQQVTRLSGKGKIDSATAASLSTLLDTLIAQQATVPLDLSLIQQLQVQINASTLSPSIKTSLLNKANRLINLSALNRSLANFTQVITNKTAKGVLSDTDSQNLLNLLGQIQNAL